VLTCLQEELAEGLHLIDFEQLKIENQTYNEKIEERNEVCTHCTVYTRTSRTLSVYFAMIFRTLQFVA